MSNFLQLHTLTSYGPSCLNRDDQGRPKTAVLGGVDRLRISSQCLKRTWRTSDVFTNAVGDHLGIRTRNVGKEVVAHLLAKGIKDKAAKEAAKAITDLFKGGEKKGDEVLFLFSPAEWTRVLDAAEAHASGKIKAIACEDVLLLKDTAVDVALWGRMLAAKPNYNKEAAAQVSHAITTHKVLVEDDYFAAVDERPDVEHSGAGHINVRQFGAGTFYTYICVDRDLLVKNLSGEKELASIAIGAMVQAATTVSPGGMAASFASRSSSSYVLAEVGNQQPRSLVGAFTKPVRGNDQVADSVAVLSNFRSVLNAGYGPGCDEEVVMDLSGEEARGSLADVVALARRL
jgi:CRISPR system Cascade subunit CasC